ncbi:5-formyltetrahydrofolate cyclo-ligase [Pseudosulfitobacter koreensis]|uniref:5-formyltetrahydrofolate cyclo-ligase n=1 Tax=Pseudosulfitobacter koreensis TaxID=2968472 RepID=A0ABT1Z516_9RHOB|nr:5-formyltetrahydrofolate cyclo-ligase [Pseudosulfitobacter koreense]MCR8828205.1 5-formyltetrahydrofolate cyclo-ligase [Pseudosulfitobacter koreense]
MEDESVRGTAPCFAHLLVDGHLVDPATAQDVARFRRAERSRLIAARSLSSEARLQAMATLIAELDDFIAPQANMCIAVYWPIRGEPDLRPWMHKVQAAGAQVLLPVMVAEQTPLEFHTWWPDCRMKRGLWNILEPAEGEARVPDVVIAPLVGVDEALYRLGNGGGYYDRTLVRLNPRPRVVGVGFAGCLVPTIYPMPWDVPMDVVVLSDGSRLQR